MVLTTTVQNAARQKIIYGVKRGKIPLALRPTAPPQKRQNGATTCLQEFDLMMNCWQENSYTDSPCSQQIHAFMECSNTSMAEFKSTGGKSHVKYDIEKLNEVLRKHTIVKKRNNTEKREFFPLK